MSISGVPVPGEARLQGRLAPSEYIGKELTIETNAAERADFRLMLHELSDPVEVGLKKKFVRQQVWMSDKPNFVEQFEKEFDTKKEEIYKKLVQQRDLNEWREAGQNAIANLRQLQEVIRQGDESAIMDMRGSMNLMRMGGRNDIGYEASQRLAEIFSGVARQQKISEAAKRAAADSIERFIRQQISVDEFLATATAATSWDDLPEEAKAHVYRFYTNLRWSAEMGTIERGAEFEVLKRRRGRHGTKAPHKVFEGSDRQVYENILAWRALKEKLKGEEDPDKREEIKEQMRVHEDFVQEWTSDLTGTFDGRMELGPIGINQVKQGAWAEIRHTIDRIRNNDGQVQKALVYTSASYDQGSWEAVGMKGEIYAQFGIASNALKHLESMSIDEFVNEYAVVTQKTKLSFGSNLTSEIKEKERILSDLENADKKRKFELERANQNKASLEAELDALKKLELNDGGENTNNNQRRNNQNRTASLTEDIKATGAKSREINDSIARLQAEELDAEKEKEKFLKELNDLRARQEKENADKEKANAAPELPPKEAGDRTKEREQYQKLLAKLHEYINQNHYNKEFYGNFTEDEIQVIAKLNGLTASQDELTKKFVIGIPEVATGTVEKSHKDRVKFVGDYAFINAWELPEMNGRISPDIIQQMFDKPEAYPQIQKLIEELKLNNKIVIVTSFAAQHDVDGGIAERNIFGYGRGFNFDRAEELKKANGWSETDLFVHWLDDINIQRELGVHPEEVESRYNSWMAKNHFLRESHFKADDGWTVVSSTVSNAMPSFFETAVRRMLDAGLELDGQSFRRAPFNQQLGKTNEYTYTVVDKDMSRRVLFRGKELQINPEAPKTIIDRTYRSLMKRLELYSNNTLIGAQATSAADHLGDGDITKLGSLVQANLALLEKKMITLRTIYSEASLPGADPEAVLRRMIDWAEGNAMKYKDGIEVHDDGMINLTYDIMDENGEFIEESANQELWEELNGTAQWLGKLKRNMRESELVYANTVANKNATVEDIRKAEDEYYGALSARRNFEVKQYALGMQAAGRMRNMSNKEIGHVFANKHAKITSNAMLRLQERQMRAFFDFDSADRGGILGFGGAGGRLGVARRLVGKLVKNRVADVARSLGGMFGLGDRFLKEVDQQLITHQIRDKVDTEIIRRAAAHMSFSIQTGYQNTWAGVFHPEASDTLFTTDDVIGVDGKPILDDIDAPSSQLSPTGRRYVNALELRIRDDIGDAIDRTILMNTHRMVKAGRRRGWNIDELMHTYLEAKMNDNSEVEYRNGQWQYDMYGKRDMDNPGTDTEPNYSGVRVSAVDRMLQREVRNRLRRDFGWKIKPSPDDTKAVPARMSNPPVATQLLAKQNREAGNRGAGNPIDDDPRMDPLQKMGYITPRDEDIYPPTPTLAGAGRP